MIGRLRRVPVSELYGTGGVNFTSWLQENIDVLNETLGFLLSGVRDERLVSGSSATVAQTVTGDAVIIENEPKGSGDGGLGKLITSLASEEAQAGIWIVADPRPEHAAAISWLNRASSSASFYLLKVEAFRIDGSPPAPLISSVIGPERGGAGLSSESGPAVPGRADVSSTIGGARPVPNPAATGDGSSADEPAGPAVGAPRNADGVDVEEAGVSAREHTAPAQARTTGLVLYRFWTELLNKARERTSLHADVEPRRETVIGANAGVEGIYYNYVVREHEAGVELYINQEGEGRGSENGTAFDALQAVEDAIAYNFGGPLEWRQDEGSGAGYIEHRVGIGGYLDEERWPEIQDAMIDAMIRLERALRPQVSRLR